MGIRVVVHFKTDSLLTDTFLNLQFASSYSLNLSWTVKRNYSTLEETSLISLMHQNKIQTAAGKKNKSNNRILFHTATNTIVR